MFAEVRILPLPQAALSCMSMNMTYWAVAVTLKGNSYFGCFQVCLAVCHDQYCLLQQQGQHIIKVVIPWVHWNTCHRQTCPRHCLASFMNHLVKICIMNQKAFNAPIISHLRNGKIFFVSCANKREVNKDSFVSKWPHSVCKTQHSSQHQ